MDQKRQRTISDIRPARSMDGVTPVGNRQSSGQSLARRPQSQQPEPLAIEPVNSTPPVAAPLPPVAKPMPVAKSAPVAKPVVEAPQPVTAPANKPKSSKRGLKRLMKVIVALVVIGALSAAGWVVYAQYFR